MDRDIRCVGGVAGDVEHLLPPRLFDGELVRTRLLRVVKRRRFRNRHRFVVDPIGAVARVKIRRHALVRSRERMGKAVGGWQFIFEPGISDTPMIKRHPHPIHRVVARIIRLIHVVVLRQDAVAVGVERDEIRRTGRGTGCAEGITDTKVRRPEQGCAHGARMDALRQEPEFLFVEDRLLSPAIPVAVHFVPEPDHDAVDSLLLVRSAKRPQIDTNGLRHRIESLPWLQGDQSDAAGGKHFAEKIGQAGAPGGGERNIEKTDTHSRRDSQP